MSILLGRNGITPWIEDAAFTDVTTDWSSSSSYHHSSPTSNHARSRSFQRPRPAKVVQVVACYWETNNNCTVVQPLSSDNKQQQPCTTRSMCPPYLILHDGLTSISAFLSEKVQSRLFSSLPEEATTQQQQKYLEDQFTRKPGSMLRISGWSFSSLVICTGKHYFHHNTTTNHHLSWPLTLLIEDFVEMIGAEGTGQTIDRPRDVNESLRIQSALNALTHWELYQRLALAYRYFNTDSSSSTTSNNIDAVNYYLPDLRGVQPATNAIHVMKPHRSTTAEGGNSEPESLNLSDSNGDDDQGHIAGINEMLSDDGNDEVGSDHREGQVTELSLEAQFVTQQSQSWKPAPRAQSHVRKSPCNESSEETKSSPEEQFDTQRPPLHLKQYSAMEGNGPGESQSAQQLSDSQPQRYFEESKESEPPQDIQFDTQKSQPLEPTSRPQPHEMAPACNESSEEPESPEESQFDTQPPQPHLEQYSAMEDHGPAESECAQQLSESQPLSEPRDCETSEETESQPACRLNSGSKLHVMKSQRNRSLEECPTFPLVAGATELSSLRNDANKASVPVPGTPDFLAAARTKQDVTRKKKLHFGAYFLDQLRKSDQGKLQGPSPTSDGVSAGTKSGIKRKKKVRFGDFFFNQLKEHDHHKI